MQHSRLNIINTKIEPVTAKHKTPWVSRWTLHTVEIDERHADKIAQEIAQSLDKQHKWYADFKNERIHYIIFRNKVFKVDRSKKEEYDRAIAYGIALGIPDYQVDFSPYVHAWTR